MRAKQSRSSKAATPVDDLRGASAHAIKDRLSTELVIGLVGPVGSGVSTSGEFIRRTLSDVYQYAVCDIIKPSDFIKREASRVRKMPPPPKPMDTYVSGMQDIGNELRARFGGAYLAEKSIEAIVKFRTDQGGYEDGVERVGRRAYIIDSIKNVEELDLLRETYGDRFCLIGVFAPDSVRRQRLHNNGIENHVLQGIMNRDDGEVPTFGQQTRKVFVEADLFVCNDRKIDELHVKINRFLELVFSVSIHSPTKEESAMFQANAASLNSACMSRQVGAAIISRSGELISVGWNDVPKFGGGLYSEDDQFVFD